MRVHGLQKLTLVDFPGLTAAILFTGGCNFRCPFCQNGSLVLNPEGEPVIEEEEIFDYLKKRKKLLEGVVITGGEPTIEEDLIPFIIKVKNLGYKVKLDTNGFRPMILKEAVEKARVDYVAMDIKNSLDAYGETCGIPNINTEPIKESIEYLKSGIVDYEFRTTVVKELHKKENFEKIASLLSGALRYFLQSYIDSEDVINRNFTSPDIEELNSYIDILKNDIKNVQVRDR